MEPWLKWLIAAACVVVIAGGSLMLIRDSQERARIAEAREERSKIIACRNALAEIPDRRLASRVDEEYRDLLVACRVAGYITDAQWQREVVAAR